MPTPNSHLSSHNRSVWSSLEPLPGLNAIPSVWSEKLGEEFNLFKAAFLQPRPAPAQSFPCRNCGCAHDVTIHGPGDIVAVCACDPWNYDDLILTPGDIEILELNWSKLARAVCKAFGLAVKLEDYGPPNTVQIGAWSADAVPVILTIQWDEGQFRHVVASLVVQLHRPFILLAPTSSHLDATSLGCLASIGAEFLSLESHLILTEHGAFQPTKAPGEIFVRFRPEPTDDEEMLRKAILLAKAADTGQGSRKVTLYAVMRLYCFDCRSAREIARHCRCARSLVYARLAEMRKKLGREPAELRRYSGHFDTIQEALSDPRAKRVYRKGGVYGDEGSGEYPE